MKIFNLNQFKYLKVLFSSNPIIILIVLVLLNIFGLLYLERKLFLHEYYKNKFQRMDAQDSIESSYFYLKLFPLIRQLSSNISSASNSSNFSNLTVGGVEDIIKKLSNALIPLIIAPPIVPINQSCRPIDAPVLCPQRALNTSSRRIGILLQFGFDADTLEIHLNQLGDIVDQFFIVESTRSHFRAIEKVLIWERIKDQSRFKRFRNKITHFVLDDAGTSRMRQSLKGSNLTDVAAWDMEMMQEKFRWESFLLWNNATGMFQSDDLLGFGDTDEIPSRSSVLKLKHCSIPIDPVDIGIWFPYGNIHQAFKSDFPVKAFPFTLGDPTFWKLSTAMEYYLNDTAKAPGRLRGKSPAFILGGMHMTNYGYFPFGLIKKLTMTESSIDRDMIKELLKSILGNLTNESIPYKERIWELEKTFQKTPKTLKNKILKLEALRQDPKFRIDEIAILPWFYDCNRNRYPAWEWKHDTRLH